MIFRKLFNKFATPISNFIDRFHFVKHNGTTISCKANDQTIPCGDKSEYTTFPPVYENNIYKTEMENWEKTVKDYVDKMHNENGYSKEDILIRKMAEKCLCCKYEQTYNVISKSQYSALE